jgi:Zn-dependent metalloprotease
MKARSVLHLTTLTRAVLTSAFIVAAGYAAVACGSSDPAATLASGTGTSWVLDRNATWGTVNFAFPQQGAVALPAGSNDVAVLSFLAQYSSVFGMQDPANEWKLVSRENDDKGFEHLRYAQMSRGVMVYPGTWLASVDASGRLASMSGTYVPGAASATITPAKSGSDARSAAIADVVRRVHGAKAGDVTATVGSTTAIYADDKTSPVLAFEVHTETDTNAAADFSDYVVDAQTGRVTYRVSSARTETATGYGAPHYPPFGQPTEMVSFPVSVDSSSNTTWDMNAITTNGVRVRTSANGSKNPVSGAPLVGFTDTSTPKGAAVSAHSAFANVVQAYQAVFGRSSFDNKGHEVDVLINSNSLGVINAFYNPSGSFFEGLLGKCGGQFGIGDGDADDYIYPLGASLDIIAHEFTHGVSACSWGPAGSGQSAAVSEGMSDILSQFIAGSLIGTQPTINGKNMSPNPTTYFRNLARPHDPHDYLGPNNCDSVNDTACAMSESHAASEIVSYAWYLMTFGGIHESNKQVVPCGLGWAASRALWYQVETQELTSSPDFKAVAHASLSAGKKRGLNLMPIACAWVANGVLMASDATSSWGVTCPGASDAGADAGMTGMDAGGSSLVTGQTSLITCPDTALTGGSGAGGTTSLTGSAINPP